jgi:hypothetical protein
MSIVASEVPRLLRGVDEARLEERNAGIHVLLQIHELGRGRRRLPLEL